MKTCEKKEKKIKIEWFDETGVYEGNEIQKIKNKKIKNLTYFLFTNLSTLN